MTKNQIINILKNNCNDLSNKVELTAQNDYEYIIAPLLKLNLPIEYTNGLTKLVIFIKDNNTNFVIKIPYVGETTIDGCHHFMGDDNNWDYCELEERDYKIAEEKGLQMFFAKTELLCRINGYPIYTQPLCNEKFLDKEDYCHNENEIKTAKEIISSSIVEDSLNINWLVEAINIYGTNLVLQFLKFIDELGINDLHNHNIGLLNGKPIVFDYSGYFE